MKQRIISAFVGLFLLLIALFTYKTVIFNFIVCAVYLLAVYEIYTALKDKNSMILTAVAALLGVLVIMRPYTSFITFEVYVLIFAVAYASSVVFGFHTADFKTASAAFVYSIYVLAGIYSLMNVRVNMPFEKYGYDSAFFLLLSMAIAWGGDVCAYFSGYFFGKHKMSPVLSPKKTVEGAIGGVAGSVAFGFLFLYLYGILKPVVENSKLTYSFNSKMYLPFALMLLIGSALAIVGDLFASAVKRQAGIKDYGNIMPGHGGVLDRFDSVLLVAPLINVVSFAAVRRGGVFFV